MFVIFLSILFCFDNKSICKNALNNRFKGFGINFVQNIKSQTKHCYFILKH